MVKYILKRSCDLALSGPRIRLVKCGSLNPHQIIMYNWLSISYLTLLNYHVKLVKYWLLNLIELPSLDWLSV